MNEQTITTAGATPIDRRRVLRTGSLAAGAAALPAAPSLARAQGATEETYDLALDGRTFRVVLANQANQADPNGLPQTGDTFVMYGSIYPAGTFVKGNLNLDQPGAIGRLICRGTFNVDVSTEAVPHVITSVQHILGPGLSVSAGAVEQAPDAIMHEGLEGGVPMTRRTITGGYGKYAGARGEATQELRGQNDTLIQLAPEISAPAASYTFTFTFAK